jgi:periplasmic protein TonB
MASPEEVVQALPETLPEDFGEWDHEDSPSAGPVDSKTVETSNGFTAVVKPPALSTEPQAAAARDVDALRGEPARLPASARSEYDSLRPATSGPRATAAPRTDARPNKPSPVRTSVHMDSVHMDFEVLRPASRANGAAPDHQPGAASRGQTTARAFNDVSSSLLWPGGVVVEEVRFAPEPTPLAARVNDEDFLERLKAIGTAYNGQPATPSQRKAAARTISEESPAPANSNGAVEPRHIFEPAQETPAIQSDDEIDLLSFHSDLADLGDDDPDRKKWVRIGVASFAALVLLVFVGPRLLSAAKHAPAAQSAQLRPAAAVLDPAAKTPKPLRSATRAESHPSLTASAQQTLITQPATNVEETILPKEDSKPESARHGAALTPPGTKGAAPQVDSTLMNDQLASAPRIPQDVKALHKKEEAPPSAGFGSANSEEMGSGSGAADGVFSGQTHPAVKYVPPPPVAVPTDVAEKLLIHKTLPAYPPGAWKHYAAGKVVLEAIISETGSVEDLKVVSGPQGFQQPALDAVKTWRYKPYVVNDKPARVQTTVSLVFDPYKK